jgi:exosortase H (IPTLxxWG-CTERM-specific)
MPANSARAALGGAMWRPLLLFVGLLMGLFLLELLAPVQEHLIVPFTGSLASVSAWVIDLFGGSAAAQGKLLSNPGSGFAVSVEAGCNGVEACLVLMAAMLAYPAPWRARLKGLLIGVVAVQALNLGRIISLFYLAQWHMDWFHFAHETLWQGLIMLDVLLIFMLWLYRLPAAPRDEPASPVAA